MSPIARKKLQKILELFCFHHVPWYVYIIQSEKDGTYYKGSSEHPSQRPQEHNAGLSHFTSSTLPWKLVYVEELSTKKEMLIREKKLKRGNSEYFQQLIRESKNIVDSLG